VQPAAKNLRRALKFAINRSARHPNANVNVIVDGKKTSACMTRNTGRLTPNITARGRLPIWATGRSIVKIILTTQIAIDRFSGRGMPRSRKLKSGIAPPGNPEFILPSGRYQLIRINAEGVANGNAWIVEITAIACSPP
jgi:hypothetical protein